MRLNVMSVPSMYLHNRSAGEGPFTFREACFPGVPPYIDTEARRFFKALLTTSSDCLFLRSSVASFKFRFALFCEKITSVKYAPTMAMGMAMTTFAMNMATHATPRPMGQ